MTPRPIAEILEEGKRLEADGLTAMVHDNNWVALDNYRRWLVAHGPRLLAVAKAAVEYRAASEEAWAVADGPGGTAPEIAAFARLELAERAFDAAASGEEKR